MKPRIESALEQPLGWSKIIVNCLIIFCAAKLMLIYEWSQVVNSGLGFVDSVMRGDSWWFKSIVKHGYMQSVLTNDPIRMGQANWAFFPLFPLLTKMVSWSGLSVFGAAIFVNQIQLLAALVVSYGLALRYFSRNIAVLVTLGIAMSPANIWFMAAYSDMTFLFLSVLSFYCLSSRNYWGFAAIGFLLALSRFTGVLIVVPLVIHYVCNQMWSKKQLLQLTLQVIIIVSGLVTFMAILYVTMGDPLAFYHIQSAWGHLGTSWFSTPWQSLTTTWHSGVGHDRLFVIIGILSLMILLWDGYYEEFGFAFFCLLAPIAAGSLWSYSRYALGLYPVYLALGLLARKNYLLGLSLLLVAAFMGASYWSVWLNDGWV